MSDLETRPTDASVEAFLDAVDDEHKRSDARVVATMIADITGSTPPMLQCSLLCACSETRWL